MMTDAPKKSLQEQFREAQARRDEEIRKLYATGKYTLEEIAKQYGLTRQRVQQIVSGG